MKGTSVEVPIWTFLCGLGESDFIESRVDFTPESSAPGIIQFFDIIMIFIPQEICPQPMGNHQLYSQLR